MNQKELKNTISYILDNIDESRKVKNCAFNLHSALVLTHFGIFTINPRHERIRTG